MARKRTGIKPSYKWVGEVQLRAVETFASTSTSEVMQAVGSSTSLDSDNDVLFERMFIDFSIRRLLTTSVVSMAFIVAMQKVDSSGVLTEVLNPLTTNGFDLANRDILAIAQMPIPPIMLGTGDALRVNSEVIHVRHDIKVRRRLKRANHVLALTIVADLSSAIEVRTMTRSLLRLN